MRYSTSTVHQVQNRSIGHAQGGDKNVRRRKGTFRMLSGRYMFCDDQVSPVKPQNLYLFVKACHTPPNRKRGILKGRGLRWLPCATRG